MDKKVIDLINELYPKMTDKERIAFSIAFGAHTGQDQRDASKLEYIAHPLTVYMNCDTEDQRVVALLHDVVEDTEITLKDLSLFFEPHIVEAIGLLSHPKDGYNDKEYIANIKKNPIARKVKIEDLKTNMDESRLWSLIEWHRDRVKNKYSRSLEELEEKQKIFDTYAEHSLAGSDSLGIKDSESNKLFAEEEKRIKEKRGIDDNVIIEKKDAIVFEKNEPAKDSATNEKKKPIQIQPIQKKSENYTNLLKLSYSDLVKYLLNKYGAVPGDYFTSPSCSTKNFNISRGKECLVIHHIDEDKAIMLSTDKFAKNNPFEYQKANRLVYCDILEHLILHIKIAEEPRNKNANKNELPGIGGAVNLICRQINDYYSGRPLTQNYALRMREYVKDSFDEYIEILNYFYNVIKSNPLYSSFISKEDLSLDWYGDIVKTVFNKIK